MTSEGRRACVLCASQVPLSMSDPVILFHGIQPSHYAIRGTGV
jgi:hypothetical protein